MHIAHEVVHVLHDFGRLVDDQIGALGHDLELIVGDDRGDLDNRVLSRVEARHFQIHPHQHAVQGTAWRISCQTSGVLEISVQRLDPDLPLPAYASPGDAGVDLRAAEPAELAPGGGRALVPTGLAIAIPDGYAGFVQPRSGLALKHGISCLNTPGLIDSGYRGELKVILVNTDSTEPYAVQRGDRIAQLVIQRVETCDFKVVDELPPTTRGGDGFGSSGKS